MNDLINRRAAIDAVYKCTDYYVGNLPVMIDKADAYKALADLPAVNRWIPWYSGRLPEESGTYIVTAYDGATKRVTFAKYQKRLKRWELIGARAYWRVVAWMPLPESYGGDKDAE